MWSGKRNWWMSYSLDWIGLSSVLRLRQHSIGYMGDGFYRSKDPTNIIKVPKENLQPGLEVFNVIISDWETYLQLLHVTLVCESSIWVEFTVMTITMYEQLQQNAINVSEQKYQATNLTVNDNCTTVIGTAECWLIDWAWFYVCANTI